LEWDLLLPNPETTGLFFSGVKRKNMTEQLQHQLERLMERVRIHYDALGYSQRSPYVYCVHDPQDTRYLPALLLQYLQNEPPFTFCFIDLLSLTIDSLRGQEQRRQELLEKDPSGQAEAIEGIWVRRTQAEIERAFASATKDERPVAVLYNTAALHPISDPSSFMACLDEHTLPRHPQTNRSIPIVIFIPGFHLPASSRSYHFLDRRHEALTFYLGEEIW
jgi:hypothetical protein